MNKKNLGFIALLSIILILCIYYVSIPSSMLESIEPTISSSYETVEIEDTSSIIGLKVEKEEKTLSQIEELQNTIIDKTKTTEEKNIAYDKLKNINKKAGKEEEIENIIKKEFNYESFVKIEDDQISIVIKEKNHNKELANNIIKRIQSMYNEKKYITIKFS